MVQEHHVDLEHLADKQAQAADTGYRGFWAAGISNEAGGEGTTGGVAVLAKAHYTITLPPSLSSPVIIPGRLAAAHVHSFIPGGIVFISAYFKDSVGWNPQNASIVWQLVQFLAVLNGKQVPWVIGADWNMEPDVLMQTDWVSSIGGVIYTPKVTTCRQAAPGSKYDYFITSSWLVPVLGPTLRVQEDASTYPHLPVSISIAVASRPVWARALRQPKRFPAVPPIGCSRYPCYPWHNVITVAAPAVSSADDLPAFWDLVLEGVERELAGRWDAVGSDAEAYVGRSGPPEVRWEKLVWAPPKKRTYKDPQARAWATALTWIKHINKARRFCEQQVRALELSNAVCELTPAQYTKLLQLLGEFSRFMKKVADAKKVLQRLDKPSIAFFSSGFSVLARESFTQEALDIFNKAQAAVSRAEQEATSAWLSWARDSFKSGASQAHRFSKMRAVQEILDASTLEHPFQHADNTLNQWVDIWTKHGSPVLPLPPGAQAWPALPDITADQIEAAVASYPIRTAVGPM